MELSSFETLAEQLLKEFDPDGRRKQKLGRPFMVELLGTPNSGKTTQKQILKRFFKRLGWNVSAPTEGAEVVELPRDVPRYNLQTVGYAMQLARAAYYDRNFHMVIFDRAVYDGVVRMEYFVQQNIITPEYQQSVENFLLLPENSTDNFDASIFLVASPEVALAREPANVLTHKVGGTVNPTTLRHLLDAHQRVWDRLKLAERPDMAWIDSSNMTPGEVAYRSLEVIFRSFAHRLAQKH